MLKKMVLLLVLLSAMLPAQEKPLIIRMVRHGQPGVGGTDFTPEQKKAWIRLGLTPLGRSQADTTGKYLKKEGVKWDQVIASPQERASETADIICGIIGKTFTLEPNLREIGNPIPEPLDGLRRRFKNLAPDAVLDLTPQQRKGFKETGKQQGERGKKFIMSLFQKKAKGPILLVTHGNFMYTTIQEMTGKYANPWNCGMSELKVWPDGKAELVKATYPEVLAPDQITCNQTYFKTNPWFVKFIPYQGPRPEPIQLINAEFQKLLKGEKSSWNRYRRISQKQAFIQDGKMMIRSRKNTAGFISPRIPLKTGQKYRCVVKACGKGTGVCHFVRRSCKMEMKLDEKVRDYELKFVAEKGKTYYQAALEAAPGNEMTVVGFTFEVDK